VTKFVKNEDNGNLSTETDEIEEPGGRILYSFIRKRSQGGFHAYGLTTVKMMPTGQKVEVRNLTFLRLRFCYVMSKFEDETNEKKKKKKKQCNVCPKNK
jgi:hypothetical protein